VDLKNGETGKPIDLSLLAEKFSKMKKVMSPADEFYPSSNEFGNEKRFLD
jgi:hypothetical protein